MYKHHAALTSYTLFGKLCNLAAINFAEQLPAISALILQRASVVCRSVCPLSRNDSDVITPKRCEIDPNYLGTLIGTRPQEFRIRYDLLDNLEEVK